MGKRTIAGVALAVLSVVLGLWAWAAYEDSHSLSTLFMMGLFILWVAWVVFAASLGQVGALYRAWRDLLRKKK